MDLVEHQKLGKEKIESYLNEMLKDPKPEVWKSYHINFLSISGSGYDGEEAKKLTEELLVTLRNDTRVNDLIEKYYHPEYYSNLKKVTPNAK